jgi:uncharacterized protein YegJ (DUF2314 family)
MKTTSWQNSSLQKLLATHLATALICAGCGKPNDPMNVTVRPRTVSDPQMDAAVAKAQASITNFIAALQSPKTNQIGFSICARFVSEAKNIQENIWITGLRHNESFFEGIVALDKTEIGLAFRQPVKVALSNVVDWMYVEDGKAVGDFTGRLLRLRMSELERQKYDAELNYKFE